MLEIYKIYKFFFLIHTHIYVFPDTCTKVSLKKKNNLKLKDRVWKGDMGRKKTKYTALSDGWSVNLPKPNPFKCDFLMSNA